MKNNGIVNLLYRTALCFIYHPFLPFENVILLYIIKGCWQFEICLTDPLPGRIRWDVREAPRSPVSLWLSAGSSCYHFARMKASLGGQTPLCHFQKYLKLPASPFFSNNVLQFWLRDVFLKGIWRFFLCVCLVLASVEISTDYMKNFVQYLHLCHGCWSENSKLLCKGPSYNFYYYWEPALAWGFHCSKEV